MKILPAILLTCFINLTYAQNSFSFRLEHSLLSYSNEDDSKFGKFDFGDDQILYEISSKLSWNLKNWIFGMGFNYHQRQVDELGIYWVTSLPAPFNSVIPTRLGPNLRSDLTSNSSVEGDLKYLEVPIFIGYKIVFSEKVALAGEIQWNPVTRINRSYLFNAIDPIGKVNSSQNDPFSKTFKSHGYALNLINKINAHWGLITGFVFRSDNFSFERVRLGVNIGTRYQL